MAKMWGLPFPFCDGQWSYELNTAHFAQAHHYAHCNHCPSPLLIDLMRYSKGTRIVKINGSPKDPRKMYFYL